MRLKNDFFSLIILSLLYLVKNMSLLIPNPQMSTWLFQFVNGFTLELMMYVIQKLQKRKNKKKTRKGEGTYKVVGYWGTQLFVGLCFFYIEVTGTTLTHWMQSALIDSHSILFKPLVVLTQGKYMSPDHN